MAGKLYWHIHHERLVEEATEPIENRIAYIKAEKPKHEQATRLRLLRPVKNTRAVRAALKARDANRKTLDDDYYAKLKTLDDDYDAKRKTLADDYYAKRKPLADDYDANRKTLADDYYAKRKTLADDYYAKRKTLDDDYYAKRKTLADDYDAKLKPLADDYYAKRKTLDEPLEKLHRAECKRCPWDGNTIFPEA